MKKNRYKKILGLIGIIFLGSIIMIKAPVLITKALGTQMEEECKEETKNFSEDIKSYVFESCKKYVDEKLSITDAVAKYHKEINNIFKIKIDALLARKPNDKIDLNPSPAPACAKESTENLLTDCLATLALREYIGYMKALTIRQKYFHKDEECFDNLSSGEKNENPKWWQEIGILGVPIGEKERKARFYQDEANQASYKELLVREEKMYSKKAFDITLSAYNELYWAYPLHLKFEKMIDKLETYNEELGDLRGVVEKLEKFKDASTTECT